MKKIILKIISIIVSLYILYTVVIYGRLFFCAKNLNGLYNQEFLHFIIYGSSSAEEQNTISAHFAITDSTGNEITAIERSWNGNYLAIDLKQVEINGKLFTFPYKIYSRENIIENHNIKKHGTKLEPYYDDDNQCILLGKGTKKNDRKDLYVISRFAGSFYFVPYFKIINTLTVDLSDCESEVYYSLFSNNEGRLILRRM